MQKKIQKICFVSEIIKSESVAKNCLCEEDNTCHQMSMG